MTDALRIFLIKPSKYDDEGYVVHHVRGVLPSNSLAVLHALMRQSAEDLHVAVDVTVTDETVELVNPARLLRHVAKSAPILVCLVGVQTNQFPRALDLARQFRNLGAMVAIGGFHVSGTFAMFGVTPDLQQLIDEGVGIFCGEAEGRIPELLRDALDGKLQSIYKQHQFPDLSAPWELPRVETKLARRFALPMAGTIDTSRGCIFHCSFCTVINVQGRTLRARSVDAVEAYVRKNYPALSYYFFTDDNMARNPNWKEIFSRLITLREQGIEISFMMQVDVAAYKLPGFVEQATRAGCKQVFIGIESLNQENLDVAAKRQNNVSRFREMSQAWRSREVAVHAAYIIGFPFDSVTSVRADISRLIEEVQPDQASFFMLTPLPGSVDHFNLLKSGKWKSPDLNQYDSFHATVEHPNMSKEEWVGIYLECWKRFYCKENLCTILGRVAASSYWQVFKTLTWYAYAIWCEEQHPMITGFWRLKGRTQRRSGYAVESVPRYALRRMRDNIQLATRVFTLMLMLEAVWRRTWLTKRAAQWRSNVSHLGTCGWFARLRLPARATALSTMLLFRLTRISERLLAAAQIRRSLVQRRSMELVALAFALPQRLGRCWLFMLNFVLET